MKKKKKKAKKIIGQIKTWDKNGEVGEKVICFGNRRKSFSFFYVGVKLCFSGV